MDSPSDLPLEETRLWLEDYAERRFVPIPGELIAAHVIAVTESVDFPVRRAAVSFFWLTVNSLVVWRITHLLQAEDGPWNLVVRLRRVAGSTVIMSKEQNY
jgi:hypothetical protein